MPKMPTLSSGRRFPGMRRISVPSAQQSPAVMLRPLVRSRSVPHKAHAAFVPETNGGNSSSKPQSGQAIIAGIVAARLLIAPFSLRSRIQDNHSIRRYGAGV
jgi:hypothetical protein